jgi:hypothetical protein
MKDSAKYAKIVEWSDEDQCYVGSAPGLIFGGCHGDDEKEVFNELCRPSKRQSRSIATMVDHCPPPTSGRDFATKMQNVA